MVDADAVVIATGGFGANIEMRQKYNLNFPAKLTLKAYEG
mgnify:CR=1 FL=1